MTELINKIESYGFKDELGHPLKNCVEWQELKDKLKVYEAEQRLKNYGRTVDLNYTPPKNVQGQP